jgi:hypothetical protein
MAKKMAEGVYLCPACKQLKYREAFYVCRGGLSAYCKTCKALKQKGYNELDGNATVKAEGPKSPPALTRKITASRADTVARYIEYVAARYGG